MSNTCTCRQPQFFIPSSAFSYDERTAFTDFVLKIWTEGRFGVGCGYQPFVQMSDRRQIDVAAFHHVLETRVKLFHALDTLGRSPIQTIPHISGTQEVPAMSLKATKIIAWGAVVSAKTQVRVHNAHAP